MPFPTLLLALSALTAVHSHAFAQIVPVEAGLPTPNATAGIAGTGRTGSESITVTGSRLRTNNTTTQDPVTVITAKQIQQSSSQTVGDALRKIPSTGFGGLYGTTNNGGQGASCTDFHNLGISRVLVLIDGKRAVHSGIFGVDCVDLSNIPTQMVDRIEILKDGASSIYGADAVSGVVNVILKHNMIGTTVNVGGRITGEGDGQGADLSASTGFDFGPDDRGNVAISGAYTNRRPTYTDKRDWTRNAQRSNNPTGPLTSNSTYTPNGRVSPLDDDGSFPASGSYGLLALGNNQFRNFTNADRYDQSRDQYLLGGLETENITGTAHYDVDRHLTAYFDGWWTHKETSQQLAANPISGGLSANLPDLWLVPAGNPFNPFGQTVYVNKRASEFGERTTRTVGDEFQFTPGIKGEIGGGWDYDLSYTYGKSTNVIHNYGGVNFARLEQEMGYRQTDPDDPDTGVFDPSVCQGSQGCTLQNPFGPGSIDSNGVRYAGYTGTADAAFELRDLVMGVTNNHVLKLPYGPVGISLGFEHRSEQGHYHPDPLVSTGDTLENTQQPTAGGFNVSEVYGELHVPILTNLPFAKDLSASASGRWSDYNTFGSTQTWKVGLNWTPVRDIRFRANLGTAFRQPGINELYGGQALSFNSANDPCANAAAYGSQSGIVSANCRAQGINTATFQQSGSQIKTLQGGNPALQPETSRTYTIGTVITPRWVPNLSLSVDYYHTQIAHSIGSVDTQTIVDNCYTSPGLSNQFCSLLSGRDASGQLLTVSALNQNLGVTRTNGLDLTFSYMLRLPGANTLTLSDDMEKLIGFTGQNLPDGPFINYTGTEYYPRLRNNFAATITHGPWSFTYTQRFIDGQNFYPGTTYAPGRARVYRFNEVFYHDIMASYHGHKFDVIAGIDNVADKTPLFEPLGAINTNADIYDVLGRLFYVKTSVHF